MLADILEQALKNPELNAEMDAQGDADREFIQYLMDQNKKLFELLNKVLDKPRVYSAPQGPDQAAA